MSDVSLHSVNQMIHTSKNSRQEVMAFIDVYTALHDKYPPHYFLLQCRRREQQPWVCGTVRITFSLQSTPNIRWYKIAKKKGQNRSTLSRRFLIVIKVCLLSCLLLLCILFFGDDVNYSHCMNAWVLQTLASWTFSTTVAEPFDPFSSNEPRLFELSLTPPFFQVSVIESIWVIYIYIGPYAC